MQCTFTRFEVMRGAFCALMMAAFCGCASDEMIRPPRSSQALLKMREEADQNARVKLDSVIQSNLTRIKGEYDDFTAGRTSSPPVVDLLVISGGGDWGAFGAGFLKGWGKVPPGELAKPKFDGVTGVSRGALIAPFAFLGDDPSIEKVVHLYRNPQKEWVKPRGLLSFLSGGSAYADIPRLEKELDDALDPATLKRIADEGATGRILAVNTTNIDTQEMHVWDVAEAARISVESGNADRVKQILLASSAIPGAFPPREIDGHLYIDGGITGNIIYGGRRVGTSNDGFVERWQEAYPNLPLPKIRYWVIFNNEIRWPPEVVQPRWSSVLARSSTTSTRAATLNAMRQMFLQAEFSRLKHQADVEVRIVAVPDGWVAPKPGWFVKETMNVLADLGEKMGADPTSWRTTPP